MTKILRFFGKCLTGRSPENEDLAADSFRSAFIRGFITLSVSIAAYCAAAMVITGWYHPDLSASLRIARELLVDANSAAPKPVERLLYSIAVLFFPLCFFLCSALLGRWPANIPPKTLRRLYAGSMTLAIGAVLLIVYAGFAAPNPCAAAPQNNHDFVAKSNLEFYFISHSHPIG